MTNFEKIKQMSIDDFCNFINELTGGFCNSCKHQHYCTITEEACFAHFKKFLESEVEEEC